MASKSLDKGLNEKYNKGMELFTVLFEYKATFNVGFEAEKLQTIDEVEVWEELQDTDGQEHVPEMPFIQHQSFRRELQLICYRRLQEYHGRNWRP